jgi:lysophospholipase L1-like esterase
VKPARRYELALLGAAILITLGLTEIGLRVAGYRYSPLKVLTPLTETDYRFQHVFQSSDFTFDPVLIWRPLPAHGVFNTQGFRGKEIRGPKPDGVIRVLAVGDSNTLGHQRVEGANWPLFLETFDPRLSVANAGVYGYTSFQGVRRLRECLAYDPDLVLISFGANDAHIVGMTDADYARRLAGREGLLRVVTRARVGQLLIDAYDKLRPPPRSATPVHRVTLDEYRANLKEMIRLCREHNARPVLLTRPFQGHSHDPENWKSVGSDYNQVTREVGAEMDVNVVDVFKEFKRRRKLFEDESHFTREGHWEAARYVYAQIEPLLHAMP